MTTEHEKWLALTTEEPLEPTLPICDPHHHLWEWSGFATQQRYFLEEFLRDASGGHNIVRTVFVECHAMYRPDGPPEMRPLGETEFVQGIAAQSASGGYGPTAVAAGIVSFAELTLGDAVASVLEAHMVAGAHRLRGIRHSSAHDPSPQISSYMSSPKGLLLDARFRAGFARLRDYGLSFDAWLYHPQLPELADLARAFPGTTIILDHIGGPLNIGPYTGRRDEVFRDWQRGMTELATCANVVVKLGGLGMRIGGYGWHERDKPPSSAELAEAFAPYYLFCIEQFGVNRCMFESNFPVDKISYSYAVMWNAFKRLTSGFSAGERVALFHDTAARAYRLV